MTRIDLMKEIEAEMANSETASMWAFDYKAAMKEIELQVIGIPREAGLFGTCGYAMAKMIEVEEVKESEELPVYELEQGEDDLCMTTGWEEPKDDILLADLLKGAKKETKERTAEIFTAFLENRPTTFKAFKAIANEVYTKDGGKPVEGSFLRKVIINKFVGNFLIEWTGNAKDPITWK